MKDFSMTNRVLSLCAPPDDTGLTCAGVFALPGKKGWEIYSATMTGGDGGSAELSREQIRKIRKAEAAESI